MSAVSKAKAAAARARKAVSEAKSENIRRMTVAGSGYIVGRMKRSGNLDRIPSFFGAPKLATVAVVGWGMAQYAGGKLGDVGEGLLDMSLGVGAFQFGAGEEVSGAGYDPEVAGNVDPLERYETAGELPPGDEWDDGGEYDADAEEWDAVLGGY